MFLRTVASFDFLYLTELQKQKIAAPSVQSSRRGTPQSGGAVFEPDVGIHNNVWVCDFKSLYPSIIRTFNIDPLSFYAAETEDDPICTIDGTRFARQVGILPGMLDKLFPQRAAAKQAGNDVASQAIKILMNSFYGVLGAPACRFYNPKLSNAITSQGRFLLNWSRDWFENRGYKVVYGDTDSVFILSGENDGGAAISLGQSIVEEFNQALSHYIAEQINSPSYLELEFEKLYSQLFLAPVRGGASGARKRYAGLVHGGTAPEFVGMEVVRRDWTELAKQVQRTLFTQLFSGELAADQVASYVQQVVTKLRKGSMDNLLVYRKGLRKDVASYTTNIPPHVQAVKKSQKPAPRVVRYVITQAGPELVDEQQHEIDREHYVARQVQPVAEPILQTLGLEFEQVIGDDTQTDMFA